MENYFDIDRQSGVIRTSRRLDRELSALHNITVLATESCKSHDIRLSSCEQQVCLTGVSVSVDHSQVGKAVVLVSVTDVNDNAPSFPVEYHTFICEDAQPGQVRPTCGSQTGVHRKVSE